MNESVKIIPLINLGLSFLPVVLVVIVLHRWKLEVQKTIYAFGRMLLQLLLVGYVLTYIFNAEKSWIVLCILTLMLLVASWIALGPVAEKRLKLYPRAFIAIIAGGTSTLFFITQVVLDLNPWFSPRYLIPLGGMIFANSMNAVSLAAERFLSEIDSGHSYTTARKVALRTSLIPPTNILLAAGLVSIPGLMTGQILSNVSPLIAARYQIMVMSMLFGSAGLTSVCFLVLLKKTVLHPEK